MRIAALFDEIADLLGVLDGNPYRIRAYRNAARRLRRQPASYAERAAGDAPLDRVAGIGTDLEARVREIARTGRCELLLALRHAVPRGTASLLRIPGFGPGRVRALHARLGVHTPAELRDAAFDGRLAGVPGFGPVLTSRVLRRLPTPARGRGGGPPRRSPGPADGRRGAGR